jgi:Tautomerase enzyme
MPLIRIDMHSALADKRDDISAAVHGALVEAWTIPADDLFQIFQLHEQGDLFYSRTHPDAARTDIVFIQILAYTGYSPEQKQQGASLVADRVAALGIKRDNLLIAINENGDGDWFAPSKDA